jgi:hypothetical protein
MVRIERSDIGRRGRPGRPSGVDVGAVAGQTDAMGRVVSGVWAGAPGNVRRGEHRERMMLPAEFSLELVNNSGWR